MQVTENQSEISQATAAEFAPEAAKDKDNDRTQKDALFLIAFLATRESSPLFEGFYLDDFNSRKPRQGPVRMAINKPETT